VDPIKAEKFIAQMEQVAAGTNTALVCAYCGKQWPSTTEARDAKSMAAHATTCIKHPMTQLRMENESLKIQVKKLEKDLRRAQETPEKGAK